MNNMKCSITIDNIDYTITIKKLENESYFAQCDQVPGTITQCYSIDEAKSEMVELIPEIIEANKLLERKRKNKSFPPKKEQI